MAKHIVVGTDHPFLLEFAARSIAHLNGRNPWHPATARTVALLDDDFQPIAVSVFDGWTENSAELSIGTDGTKRWASRDYIDAVYRYGFDHCGKNRLTMVSAASNTQSLVLQEKLGHVKEGVLRDWFGVGEDGVIFSFLRRDWINSRWCKDTKGEKQWE